MKKGSDRMVSPINNTSSPNTSSLSNTANTSAVKHTHHHHAKLNIEDNQEATESASEEEPQTQNSSAGQSINIKA